MTLAKYNHAVNENRNLEIQMQNHVVKRNNLKRKIVKTPEKELCNEDKSHKDLQDKMNELSHKLEVVENNQNRLEAKNLDINKQIPNLMLNANMSAFERNMQMLAWQYQNREINYPLIQGLAPLRNSLYPFHI